MKVLILTIFVLFASTFAQAECNTYDIKRRLVRTFRINGSPITWQSVHRKTFTRNRAFPLIVYATNRVNSSKLKYKRNLYDLSNTDICYTPETETLSISHKDYGTLLLKRIGDTNNDSIIRVTVTSFANKKIYLRPIDIVQ